MIRRHPELGAGIRRTLERRIRAWRALRRRTRGDFPPGPSAGPDGPVRLHRHGRSRHHHRRRRSITGSITSACSSPASNTPMSCSAAKALSRWRKGCRTPCGRSAASPNTSQRQPVRRVPQSRPRRAGGFDAPLRSAVRPLRHDADPQQPGVAHENGSIESAHGHLKERQQTRCCCAPRATSTIFRPGAASSTKSSAAATPATPRIDLERRR